MSNELRQPLNPYFGQFCYYDNTTFCQEPAGCIGCEMALSNEEYILPVEIE